MSSSLKIAITCFPTFGGSGVVATEVGMAMAQRGHKVHFVCHDVPGRLERFTDNVYFHEVEVRDYPLFTYTPYSLALTSKMVEVASYEKIDVFHVHYAVPHATSAYLAKQVLKDEAPKIVTTLHGTDITLVGNDRSYLPITRFSIAESDGVTTPSKYLKHATYDKLNVSTDVDIEVIPNFVDTERFRPATADERCGLKPLLENCQGDTKIITHVSNFRPVKRLRDVVDAFDIVQREISAHLILVGDGPERSKMENKVRELGLKDKVCFLGKQESFVRILQNSDLFILPSENESFGLAALEAMSCGVPVIASNAEGIPEVVTHGETGFLSAVGDVKDMANHAISLLTNDNARLSMANAARERVLSKFGQDALVTKYEEHYERVLAQ